MKYYSITVDLADEYGLTECRYYNNDVCLINEGDIPFAVITAALKTGEARLLTHDEAAELLKDIKNK